MNNLEIRHLDIGDDNTDALVVRKEALAGELLPAYERGCDGKDSLSEHLVVYAGDIAVASARFRAPLETSEYAYDAVIERVAVLPAYRRRGIGDFLMTAIINELSERPNVRSATLVSPTHTVGFFRIFGFIPEGEAFRQNPKDETTYRKMYRPIH